MTDKVLASTTAAVARPRFIVSLDSTGVPIGWDSCGSCLHHITVCGCVRGPVPPSYLAKLGVGTGSTDSSSAASSTTSAPATAVPAEVSTSSSTSSLAAAPAGAAIGPACSACGERAPGDRNDDGSFTCHACQAGK